ncbi:MAG: TIGR00730 family Rossman fold protein [Gemmatimonadales bacterium]|jgi:uncharacterized protein (TIGR00730 family)|nr:MAG: TIGR00730 family Rossman fold protein [Gemmatimonadales bacterium]
METESRGSGGETVEARSEEARAAAERPTPPPATHETEDERFLSSPVEVGVRPPGERALARDAWRVFRIMGEFVEGFEALSQQGPCVSFFGSARAWATDQDYLACVETARRLGEAGFGIITGGGPGIMEAANQGAREAGVPSIGCNIELPFEQGTNHFVDISVDFRYFFVRKTMFVKYAEAFVIFPGGFGTMDELFESLTLIQTGKIRDFPVVLFGTEYWAGLMGWIRETMLEKGKISEDDLRIFCITDDPEEVVRHILERYRAMNGRAPRS